MRSRRLNNIDLNLLVLFESIYRENSLTAAANTLGMTQPAVSHALNRLRDQLDDPLFVRAGKGLRPTAFARGLIGDVRASLSILERRFDEDENFDPAAAKRSFRLAMREAAETQLLPELYTRVQELAPGIELASARADRLQIETLLAQGRFDLAVDVNIPVGFETRQVPLGTEQLLVVARAGHPVLRHNASLDHYLACRHVLVTSRKKGGGMEDYRLNDMGLSRSIAIRVAGVASALALVAKSDLLLTMSSRHARALRLPKGLNFFPLPFDVPSLESYLYYHVDLERDAAALWLVDQITAVASHLLHEKNA